MSKRKKPDIIDTKPTRERKPDEFRLVALRFVYPNDRNPRRSSDPMRQAELEASIREKGIIEPLILRGRGPIDGVSYEVVAGMRRFAAANAVGLAEVPAVIKDLDDNEALETALTENTQRQDMHPIDEAKGYASLQSADKRIYTVATIARRVGQTESHVYRRLKLLELSTEFQAALAEDRLSIGHAEKLMRLPVKLQREAGDLRGRGVVWSRSPLLDFNEKWTPSKEDLLPLAQLEEFIRERSHFDPTSDDTKHFQPELSEAIERAVEEDFTDTTDTETDILAAKSEIVELSDDPLARTKLGARPGDPIPLTPSKWRAVKHAKDRCEFTVRGVIVHGGPARLLDVCTKKSCQKHWPVAKKKRATRSSSSSAAPKQETWQERQAREEKERVAAAAAWAPYRAALIPALIEYTKGLKVTAALIATVCDGNLYLSKIRRAERVFDVRMTDSNIGQVLALTDLAEGLERRDYMVRFSKRWKFNFPGLESKVKAGLAAKAKADQKKTTKTVGREKKAKGKKAGKKAA